MTVTEQNDEYTVYIFKSISLKPEAFETSLLVDLTYVICMLILLCWFLQIYW